MLNLSVILEDIARRYPDSPAFTLGDQTYCFRQIDEEACRVAGGLQRLGIRPGDRIALCCPNTPYFPIVYFGILKAGAVVVPINVLLKKEEIAYQLTDSGALAFFCCPLTSFSAPTPQSSAPSPSSTAPISQGQSPFPPSLLASSPQAAANPASTLQGQPSPSPSQTASTPQPAASSPSQLALTPQSTASTSQGQPAQPQTAPEGWQAFLLTETCLHFFLLAHAEAASSIPGCQSIEDLTCGEPPIFDSVRTGADDTAVIAYTSGTTGRPKGAELSHSNLFCNALLSVDLLRLTRKDVQLLTLPMFHIFAMTVQMNAAIYKGFHSILLPRFEAAEVVKLIHRFQVSVFAGVPTMYWGLLNHTCKDGVGVSLQPLRLCVSGGAALPVKVLEDFESRFGVPVLEGYGMSEGSPVVTFNHLDQGRKPGSIGTPVWGVEVKLTDIHGREVPQGEKGELCYKGHNVMKGYYKKSEATSEVLSGGWLKSGDIAVKDSDGFYFIVDRTKDMIIRGGENIYPREVEELMMLHEAISLVAVIGIPCEKFGEEVKAFVVLKNGASASPEAIIEWTKEHLAAYKYPRLVEIVSALPMTATGKILKGPLRDRHKNGTQ